MNTSCEVGRPETQPRQAASLTRRFTHQLLPILQAISKQTMDSITNSIPDGSKEGSYYKVSSLKEQSPAKVIRIKSGWRKRKQRDAVCSA